MMRDHFKPARKARRPFAKVTLLAAAVALLALTVAGPVMAKPAAPPKVKTRPFMAQAIVVSVDTTAGVFSANVLKGNRAMKHLDLIGEVVTFTVGESTVIVRIDKEGATVIKLADLVAKDRVLINGRIDRTAVPVFRARLIRDRGPAPAKT